MRCQGELGDYMYAMKNNPITNAVSKLTKGCERKMMQASKAFGVGR
jgi:hypothetical protein